ncbi:hypothetical protein GCM10010478_04960 [Streptomyces erythrogriseus]|uniref:Uncharacterized protein n=4 Tax=Streptomyces TaxID=1883 RepID=A0ABP7XZ33_9ACTN|nr:hypothetical protein GCM10010265_21370 [Streptomyces griseoincarnatus]GGT32615.1 hypothetical protein GCM10010287_00910 [Streptomyces variabilis]
MTTPPSDRVGAGTARRKGDRVLFVVLVCVLAAVPAAGLALTSGAVTHTRPDTLPRSELRALLCRAGPLTAPGALTSPAPRAAIPVAAGHAPRPRPHAR